MTTLNSRLQLAMLNRKKARNALQKGFTLVELMIVIVIVGILSAVALPNFIGTKDKATAGATIGAMAAQAKLCGANMVIEDPNDLDDVDGVTVSGACSGGTSGTDDVTITNTDDFDADNTGGVNCGGDQTGGTTCTLTVDAATGTVTGEWS
ncbi:Fimbrial protein precursor [Synechococcus sp. MIT S9509]|uniref:pilin n=1 Tax=Synechococcus sp. MIT S9509 TaxID=1801630 RepID=UPI0007BB9273|nr:type II secretion system protein [Synechococcus sp. MIT S9509]KZR92338.1 Fimbrial protein precursor [Synechococcus sp. MIT S9509]